jgi:hypothetical protein
MTTQTPLCSVFERGRVVDFVLDRGVAGFESYDANETSLGLFETAHRAATALRELAAMGRADGDL